MKLLKKSVLLASLFLLGLLPFAQVPRGPDSPETAARCPRHHGPMKFYGRRSDGTMLSTNWSGYAVTGSSFTSAQGSWIVPSVDCTQTPDSYSSFWVGIDGDGSSTVEQTGTDSDCVGTTPDYYAWFEFFPHLSHTVVHLPVSPGDEISAEVTYDGLTSFTITITDETTGQSYTKETKVSGTQRASAEWIAEAPSTNGGVVVPLSPFGTVSMGGDYTGVGSTDDATDASTSGPIANFGANLQKIVMVNNQGAEKAVPSKLTQDGTSFSVTWKAAQ